jgi:hypothetical protein
MAREAPDGARLAIGLGLDPGHLKCGLAALDAERRLVFHRVVPADQLDAALADIVAGFNVVWAVVGDGTRSAQVTAVVARHVARSVVYVRDETGTTLLGRERYWREHPPRGLWRLVPTTLRLPPVPIDDWVAVILAERFHDDFSASQAGS